MPIYAYRCEECGFAKDVLQKMSDEPLTVCLECGKPSFKKQVTAAGFQLKGSGWYVTDFRDGKSGSGASAAAAKESATESAPASTSDATTSATQTSSATPAASATAAAAPAPSASSTSTDSKAA